MCGPCGHSVTGSRGVILPVRHDALLDADVAVVGSGPGGATVARELVRRGRRVLLLERGIDERRRFYYGTYLGALLYTDRASLLFTEEGLNVVRPLMLGRRDEHVLRLRRAASRVDEGTVRDRPRSRDGRGGGGAADRTRCLRRCGGGLDAHRPGGGRGRLRLLPAAEVHEPGPGKALSAGLRRPLHARLPVRGEVERRRVGGRGGAGRGRAPHPGPRRPRHDRGRPGRGRRGPAGRASPSGRGPGPWSSRPVASERRASSRPRASARRARA